MPNRIHLPLYDAVLSDFLAGTGQPATSQVASEPAWTELWAQRSRRPDHRSNAYVVTHGLPSGTTI